MKGKSIVVAVNCNCTFNYFKLFLSLNNDSLPFFLTVLASLGAAAGVEKLVVEHHGTRQLEEAPPDTPERTERLHETPQLFLPQRLVTTI